MRAPGKRHDPGGQLTLFDIFELTVPVGVCVAGLRIGHLRWHWPGAIALALIGLCVGLALARIPYLLTLAFLRRDLRRSDTATLKERIRSQYYLAHFIVPVLQRRGEPESELQDEMLLLLLSESGDKRWHGWRTVNLCFPELAQRLRGIDVRCAPQQYREIIERVRTDLANARQQ